MKNVRWVFFRYLAVIISILLMKVTLAQQRQNPRQAPLSPRIANYEMDVRLDVKSRMLHAIEILSWKNTTAHPAPDLRFHLYYNAWRNEKSSFLTSLRYGQRGLSQYYDEDWAYCDVKSLQVVNEKGEVQFNLTEAVEFIQPDDGNPEDRTVMRVLLPRPVLPGETIRVRIRWELKIPRTFARTGVRGDYYFIAQWFPKIGVFEQEGTWNCHQFIQTEFFADYGIYDVRLTVPTGWVVGATGQEIDRRDNGDGTTTHRYYQEDVHDFVWTTSPYFRVFTETFEEPGLPPVKIRLLLMPDHLSKKERYFKSTRLALKYYGSWFGAYPYGHITVVDPAFGSHSGGMEYPTLFTGGTRWLSPEDTRSPESVTIHEAGHQFWYGIIGNNEFEDAWLDEGFNTYSQSRVMKTAKLNRILYQRYLEGFIPVVFKDVVRAFRVESGSDYDGLRSALKLDPMSKPAWQNGPGAYRVNAYNKPAMMLQTLENYLGWETFQKIISAYFQKWKFKHPRPRDFFNVVNQISGKDMSWFFEQTYYSSNVFDYAVDLVKCQVLRPPGGYVEKGDTLVFQKPFGYQLEKEKQEVEKNRIYLSSVYVRRWGEAIFPIEVKITFSNGEEVLETWDGRDRWKKFDYRRPAKVEKVEVDPRHVLTLDVNYSNNSWMRKAPVKLAAYKWGSKWMLWVQNLMEFFAFFN